MKIFNYLRHHITKIAITVTLLYNYKLLYKHMRKHTGYTLCTTQYLDNMLTHYQCRPNASKRVGISAWVPPCHRFQDPQPLLLDNFKL